MSLRDLVACLSGFSAVGAILLSVITVVPELDSARNTLVVVLMSSAVVLGIVAAALRGLPQDHWCCQPRRFHAVVALLGLLVTLLLLG
jgi:hypothetical protein